MAVARSSTCLMAKLELSTEIRIKDVTVGMLTLDAYTCGEGLESRDNALFHIYHDIIVGLAPTCRKGERRRKNINCGYRLKLSGSRKLSALSLS